MSLNVWLASASPLTFGGFLCLSLAASPTWAALLVYDGFGYTVGTALESNNPPWSGLNSGTAPGVVAGDLSVPGLAAPTGNRVTWAGGNIKEAWLQLTGAQTTGTMYYSFPFQLSSLPTATTYSFGFTQNSTTYGTTVWLQADSPGFKIGLENRTTSGSVSYGATQFPLDSTIFVVGSYEFVPGTANDTSRLWINPSSEFFAGEIAPAATLTVTGGTDLSSIQGFLLRGASGSPAGVVDELRIGTTWAAVTPVPEPTAFLVAGLGVGLASRYVICRRRKRLMECLSRLDRRGILNQRPCRSPA